MESDFLLDAKDLCIQILSLPDISLEEPIDGMNEEFRDFFEENQFPKYSAADLKQIERDLQYNNDISLSLAVCDFKYKFYPEFLNHIVKNKIIRDEYPRNFAYTVLYSFLAWYSCYLQCHDSEFLSSILHALHVIYTSKLNIRSPDCRPLAVSAFYHCYTLLYQYPSYTNYDELLYPMQEYFLVLDNLPREAYYILTTPIHQIFVSKERSITGLSAQLISFLTHLVSCLQNKFPGEIIDLIFQKTALPLYSLDFQALNFFVAAANYASEEIINLFFQPISHAIIDNVSTKTVLVDLLQNKELDSPVTVEMKKKRMSSYSPVRECKMAPASVLFEAMEGLEIINKDEKLIFSSEFKQKLDLLCRALSSSKEYAQKFTESYSQQLFQDEKGISGSQYLTYLYVCSEIQSLQSISIRSDYLYNSFVFNPAVTVFNKTEDFDIYNIIRSHALDLVVKSSRDDLQKILNDAAKYPLLFAEMMLRLSNIQFVLDKRKLVPFTKGIFENCMKYEALKDLSEKQADAVAKARRAEIIFLTSFLRDEKNRILSFNLKEFSEDFYNLFFDKDCEKEALAMLRSFLTKSVVVSADFMKSTENFFIALFTTKIEVFDWLPVAKDVISAINSVLSVSISVAHAFASITESLCNCLSKLPNNEIAEDVLMEVVSFLGFSSPGHSIKNKELVAVEAAIDRLTNNNPTDDIKDKLIFVIAGRPLSCILPDFEIKQPKVLCLLVRVFIKTNKLHDVLQFLKKLLDYSESNCRKCHDGDFDIFLVETIDEWRVTGNQAECVVDEFLTLLKRITSVQTSPIVVQRIIAFLSPINGENLPYFYINILKAFNLMLTTKCPGAYLPLEGNSAVTINGLTSDPFAGSYSLSFYLYFVKQENQCKQVLFKVYDNEQHALKVMLTKDAIEFCVLVNNISNKVSMNSPFPENIWSFVTVKFINCGKSEGKMIVELLVDGELKGKSDLISSLALKQGPVNVIINNEAKKIKTAFKGTKISSMYLSTGEISSEEIQIIRENGPRAVFVSTSSVFSLIPHQLNNRLSFTLSSSTYSLTFKSKKKHIKPEPTFGTILIDNCNVENVIPLFAQLDLVNPKKEKIPFLEEIVVDTINNVLALGESAQVSFLDVGGFKAIAYLLLDVDHSRLTYELYKRFYRLLQTIGNVNLIEQLYSSILLNLDIFIRCSPNVHQRILTHWVRIIFCSGDNFPFSILPYSWFSSALRYYYYFNKVEEKYITKNRFSGEEVEAEAIKGFRQLIYEIMKISLIRVDVPESEIVVSLQNIASNPDNDQLADILKYFTNYIIASPEVPLKHKEVIFKYSCSFLSLLKRSSEEICILLLRFFSVLYRNIPSEAKNFHNFVFTILGKFQKEFVTENIMNAIIEDIKKEYYELLPLGIWCAIVLGDKSIDSFYSSIPQTDKYYFDDMSLIYPIFSAFAASDAICVKIFNFIIPCFLDKLLEITYLIRVLTNNLNMLQPGQNIHFHFLKELIHYMMNKKPTNKQMMQIMKLVYEFVFYRQKPINGTCNFWNDTLNELYSSSPFWCTKVPLNAYDKAKLIKNPLNLTSILKSDVVPHYFGIRLDVKANWADESLVSEFIYLITPRFENLKKCEEFTNFADIYLFLGFMLERDQVVVEEFFDKNSNIDDREGLSFIRSKLITLKKMSSVIPIIHIPKPDAISLGFRYLELQAIRIQDYPSYEVSFCNQLSARSEELLNMKLGHKLPKSSVHTMFKENAREKLQDYAKIWMNMWRSMTLDRAPWNSSLPASSRKLIRFKRDNCSCGIFCPVKMRRNFNFKDHIEASLLRDKGCKKTVENEISRLKRENQPKKRNFVTDLPDAPPVSPTSPRNEPPTTGKSLVHESCILQKINKRVASVFSLYTNKITIEKKNKNADTPINKCIFIPKEDVQHILLKCYRQRPKGIEIFTKNGYSYLLFFEFETYSLIHQIAKTFHITSSINSIVQENNFEQFFKQSKITEKWINHEITNFEYLMYLNQLSGRSYNCPSMYPIFPWIIQDYDSSKLNLNKIETYRDLTKPVGALSEARLNDLLVKSRDLEEFGMKSFLYQSGYSYPLMVYLYLLRIEPFTTLHIEMQGGKFDSPGRIFSSIKETWKLVTNQSSDFRELIPEFFSLPEFLLNSNHFDLGATEKGVINDAVLPQWADDVYDFIYKNRKALESRYVSENINNWIDLIWGYKQRGEEAKKANNLFIPEMYPDIWEDPSNSEDEAAKLNIEMNLDQCGQIPQQLFTVPHPQRGEFKAKKRFGISRRFMCSFAGVSACAVQDEINDHFAFTLFNESNFFAYYDINLLELLQFNDQANVIDVQFQEKKKVEGCAKMLFFSPTCIACLSDDDTKIQKVEIPSCKSETVSSHTEIVCCAIEGDWTILSGNDASLSIFNKKNSSPMIVRTYRNSITCIAASEKFDQVVAGTKDHTLLFCSLSRGTVTSVYELGKEIAPQRILITESLGFVLVDGAKSVNGELHHVLLLFNINGSLMRKADTTYEITCWSTWVNKDGFDCIILADAKGTILFAEAFLINKGLFVCHECQAPIVGVKYLREDTSIVAVGEDGTVFFVPFG